MAGKPTICRKVLIAVRLEFLMVSGFKAAFGAYEFRLPGNTNVDVGILHFIRVQFSLVFFHGYFLLLSLVRVQLIKPLSA